MPKVAFPENIRQRNLRELRGKTGSHIAPTSKSFVAILNRNGMDITRDELSKIYKGERAISDCRAQEIEQALDLPIGWLSADHEFVFKLSPDELTVHSALTNLPTEIRTPLHALIITLTNNYTKN